MPALLIVLTLFLAPFAAVSAAPAADDLLFEATFDDGPDADVARGGGAATGEATFTDGVAGRALVGGSPDATPAAGLSYAAPGNLSLPHGTVSLWVSPLDWQGDDRHYHVFVTAKLGQQGFFTLYKHYSSGLMVIWDDDRGARNKVIRSVRIADWAPGQWHHVATTWSDRDRVTLWLDGRRVGILRFPERPGDELLAPTFTVGPAWSDQPGTTAIDELRIYNRALTPAEIVDLYAQHAPAEAVTAAREALPPTDDIVSARVAHAILDHKLLATFRADAFGQPRVARGELTARDAAGAAVAAAELVPDGEVAEGALDTTGWPHGAYTAELALFAADGTRLGATSAPFNVVTDATWESIEGLGEAPAIPPPWSPLRLDGGAVVSDTARVTMGASGLPASIVAGGEELLAAPIRLEQGGQTPLTTAEVPAPAEVAPAAVSFRGAAALGDATVDTQARLEYDNFGWYEITVPPALAHQGDLTLAIPLRAALARYLNAVIPTHVAHQRLDGYVVLGDGPWTRDDFTPGVWIGDDARGLGWFAESDQHWTGGEAPAFEVTRDGDTAVLRVRLLREPLATDQPVTFAFGLQPTPVRELAPDWRRWQWIASAETTRYLLVLKDTPEPAGAEQPPSGPIAYLYNYNRAVNHPPADPELIARQVAMAQRHGLLLMPYTDIQFLGGGTGEVWLHRDELLAQPGANFATDQIWKQVVPAGKAADYYVWFAHHLAADHGINGIYVDEAWAFPADGPAELGLGYVGADGERRATWPLRAFRETLRRVRNVMAAEHGRGGAGELPFTVLLHVSGYRLPPIVSMADQLLIGEEMYTPITADPVYPHTLTAERAQAAFLPGSMGVPTVLIPQFKASGERMRDPALARGLLAAALPHDLLVWPLFIEHETVLAARRAMLDWGMAAPETTFAGYWHDPPPTIDAPAHLYASAYLQPGRALLVIANHGDEAWSGTLHLDAARLGVTGPLAPRALDDGEAVTANGATLSLTVPAQDVRLVAVGE